MSEAIYLPDTSALPTVKVHPIAVMGILNSYMRRTDRNARIIGTLMGVAREGNIEILDCYAVPHTEKVEEEYVAINKDYHKSMFSARRHINRREAIVGWYTTTTDAGEVIINNTSLIHDFYAKECASPVHLVVDTTLIGDTMGIRAFLSVPLIAGPYTFANMFHEVKVELEISSHELVCLHQMIKGQGHVSQPWVGSTVVAAIPSEARALTESSSRLLEVIDSILEYVNGVVDGSQTAHEDIGMALADTLGATQGVRTEDFQSVFQTKTQDILMVSYLTTLIQNQLAIAEKLNQII